MHICIKVTHICTHTCHTHHTHHTYHASASHTHTRHTHLFVLHCISFQIYPILPHDWWYHVLAYLWRNRIGQWRNGKIEVRGPDHEINIPLPKAFPGTRLFMFGATSSVGVPLSWHCWASFSSCARTVLLTTCCFGTGDGREAYSGNSHRVNEWSMNILHL